MKQLRLTALAVVFFMLLTGMVGCEQTLAVTPVSPEDSSNTASVHKKAEDITIDIAADQYWTWNDLYDFLENPVRSGSLAFDEEAGEYIVLYASDWETILTDWRLPLQQDMMVIRYRSDDSIICRYYVNLTGQATSSMQSNVSHPAAESSSKTGSVPVDSSENSSFPVTSTADSSLSSAPTDSVQHLTIQGSRQNRGLRKAIEAFNRQNKTVQVEYIQQEEAVTAAKLSRLGQEGNQPQLVLMNRCEMALAVSQNLLTNLSDLSIDRLEPLFDAACWSKSAVNGGRYGVPTGCITTCLACNKEILYQCNVGIPADLNQLIEYTKTIRETLPDVTPYGLVTDKTDAAGLTRQFTQALWSVGGDLLTADNRQAAFYSVAGLEALTQYKLLYQEKACEDNYQTADFFAGKTAYGQVACTDYSRTFGRQAKANYTAAPLLSINGKQASSSLEIMSYCIPTGNSKQQINAAYEFLRFYLADPAYSLADCQTNDWIPALTAARQDSYYETEAWQVFIAAIPTANVYPAVDCLETIEGYIAQAVTDVLAGEDSEAALQKAKDKTNNRLARW